MLKHWGWDETSSFKTYTDFKMSGLFSFSSVQLVTADVRQYLIQGYSDLPENLFGYFAECVILQHDNISQCDVDIYKDNLKEKNDDNVCQRPSHTPKPHAMHHVMRTKQKL